VEEGRLGAALDCFKKVLQIEPDNGDAWYFRGLLLFRLERYAESAKNFQQATKIDPRDGGAWFNYAYALERAREYEEALEAYQHVLTLNPDNRGAEHGVEACFREIRLELLKDWNP
jgi:tetratricopeptide (TPR) repeat protein